MQKISIPSLFFKVLVVLVLFVQQAEAQSYYFRNYSVDDGLPFINVSVIYQDSKGNLWSGGYGGLSKFDGINFSNYTPRNGLLNHSVTSIAEDGQGSLWIGTIKGANKLSGKSFISYTTQQGLIGNNITALLNDSNNNLWFGTDKGLSKLNDGAFVNFSTQNGLVDNSISCIFEDQSGNIWVGTPSGISVLDGNKITNYNNRNSILSGHVTGIAEDFQHTIWIATDEGLFHFFKNQFLQIRHKKLDGVHIRSILVDKKGIVWMGTEKGLMSYEYGLLKQYVLHPNKNSELVSSLFLDYENNLWIGTYAGLFKFRQTPFVSYGIDDGLSDQFIYGILRDAKERLWVGSKNSGLFLAQNNRFIHQDAVKANSVNAIYEYADGMLWLGTDKGLIIYDGQRVINSSDTSSVYRHTINCFYKDAHNNIWMGGNNEVYKYKAAEKRFVHYHLKGRIEHSEVWTIAEDHLGTIWVGSYLGGLFKSEKNGFVECSQQLGLQNDSYLTSLVDDDGNIYWGTLDGIWMYNPETFALANFDVGDGMNSDLIYSLTFGGTQNEIWAGTNQGLNKIEINQFRDSKQKIIVPFGKEEGFSGIECNSNGTWVDKDGSIWFGTVNGLIKYDPEKYIVNNEESKTNITGFRLFYTDTILAPYTHLEHDNNNITIYCSGVCLTNPAKVQYSHMLDGFEKGWSPPSKERSVTYSNLPPGTYTFKLISENNEGVWNKRPVSFTFTVDKPFWKTWWFIISVVLFIALCITAVVRYRIWQIKKRERRKTELNKRIANIESQALRAQMNPHFIFNTLSSIQHYISNNNTDAALKYLSKFAKLMRKIMENSKQPMITVAEELNALNLFLELETMRFEKKFEYKIVVDPDIDQNYDRIPSMLIQPYVENAIVHGLLPKPIPGRIKIDLHKQGDTILCIVEDNGIGRENSKQFKQNRVQHKSMGMNITQERLDILNTGFNSNISCEIIDLFEKGEAAGTRVRLIIPLEVNTE